MSQRHLGGNRLILVPICVLTACEASFLVLLMFLPLRVVFYLLPYPTLGQ